MRNRGWFALVLSFFSGYLFGVNGRDYAYAPQPALDSVIAGVGALVQKRAFEVQVGNTQTKEQLWEVRSNVLYLGDNASGSIILIDADEVTDASGNVDREKFSHFKIRFGPTVSSIQTVKRELRLEYSIPQQAVVEIAPSFVKQEKRPGGTRADTLAIIHLPFHFDKALKPLRLIARDRNLVLPSALMVFGFGQRFKESERADLVASEYELAKSSGYLRWAPMVLRGKYEAGKQLHLTPMSRKEQELLYEAHEPFPLVEGPCGGSDFLAPLILSGNALQKQGETLVAVPTVEVAALFHAEAGICRRPDAKVSPEAAFFDLRESVLRDWIDRNLANQ